MFAFHYQLADTLGIPTYFADPYSACQRGTSEHFDDRPRKILGWATRPRSSKNYAPDRPRPDVALRTRTRDIVLRL
jgi:IS30 family transposase